MSQSAPTDAAPQPTPTPKRDPDSELIESITYLATLVSERSAIDKSLDTLRVMTSRKGDAPFTPENRAILERLLAELKDYLLHKDRVREFSEQELDARLQRHLAGQNQPGRIVDFGLVCLSSLFVAAATIVIPTSLSFLNRTFLAGLVFMMLLTLWNVWFYRSALGNFRPELKRSFKLIYIGVALLGLQFVHFTRLGFTGELILPLFKYGGLTIIAFSALTAIYFGLRRYAEALSITTIFTSAGFFGATAGLAAVVVSAYAYASSVPDKFFFSFSLVGAAGASVACIFNAGLARRISASVTTVYGRSMRWLYIFHMLGSFGAAGFTVTLAILAGVSGNTLGAALGACGIIPILVLTYSGYSFKKETGR